MVIDHLMEQKAGGTAAGHTRHHFAVGAHGGSFTDSTGAASLLACRQDGRNCTT